MRGVLGFACNDRKHTSTLLAAAYFVAGCFLLNAGALQLLMCICFAILLLAGWFMPQPRH
jgi:hypothetical protein